MIPAVKEVAALVIASDDFSAEHLEHLIHNHIEQNALPMGKIMNMLRISLVGASKGPGVANIIALIGKEEFERRINKALC